MTIQMKKYNEDRKEASMFTERVAKEDERQAYHDLVPHYTSAAPRFFVGVPVPSFLTAASACFLMASSSSLLRALRVGAVRRLNSRLPEGVPSTPWKGGLSTMMTPGGAFWLELADGGGLSFETARCDRDPRRAESAARSPPPVLPLPLGTLGRSGPGALIPVNIGLGSSLTIGSDSYSWTMGIARGDRRSATVRLLITPAPVMLACIREGSSVLT